MRCVVYLGDVTLIELDARDERRVRVLCASANELFLLLNNTDAAMTLVKRLVERWNGTPPSPSPRALTATLTLTLQPALFIEGANLPLSPVLYLSRVGPEMKLA